MSTYTQTITKTYDDLEGHQGRTEIEAANSVEVMVTGLGHVELDLNDANLDKLRSAMAPYIEAGRKVTPKKGRGSRAKATATSTTSSNGTGAGRRESNSGDAKFNRAARAWAKDQPEFASTLSTRGRLSNDVISAYKTENPNWEREFYGEDSEDNANGATNQPASSVDQDPADPDNADAGSYDADGYYQGDDEG